MAVLLVIRSWLESNLVLTLVLSFIFVMFVPEVKGFLPTEAVTYLLASVVLLACSRIHRDELKQIRFLRAVHFYWTRFLVLPIVVYGFFYFIYPPFKEAALLLALIPSGTSCPAFVSMLRGNVSMGLGGVVLSSLLAPLLIPTFFELSGYQGVEIDTLGMFYKLCIMILLPIIVYFLFVRRIELVKLALRANASAYSVVMINIVFACVIAQQKEVFFEQPMFVLIAFVCSWFVFFIMYGFGWAFGARSTSANRISFALISGANNMALAIALGTLLFPDIVSQYMVVAEVNWILFLPLFKSFLHHSGYVEKES